MGESRIMIMWEKTGSLAGKMEDLAKGLMERSMKRDRFVLIVAIMCFMLSASRTIVFAASDSGRPQALSVAGTMLVDSDGQPVQLRGISSHGLSWFPEYVNRDALWQMKEEWNCNVFRLAMYTDNYNGYCVGDEANRQRLKDVIDRAVQDAEMLGMYVIIDWHILSDGNPQIYKNQALAFFDEISARYADKTHVIYEICNEPNGVSWAEVKAYANEVIPVIRSHTNAVILVGTPTWSQDVNLAVADPLQGYADIMYTFHFYAATHREELRNRLIDAVTAGLPVFVSEFGICDAGGSGAVDEAEADRWLAAMNQYKVSYVIWNLSNKAESSAMIQNSCRKTSGFTTADLSQAGQWFVGRQTSDERIGNE